MADAESASVTKYRLSMLALRRPFDPPGSQAPFASNNLNKPPDQMLETPTIGWGPSLNPLHVLPAPKPLPVGLFSTPSTKNFAVVGVETIAM